LSRFRLIALVGLSILLLGYLPTAQADRISAAPISAEGEIWKASPVGADCAGLVDANGYAWYDPGFDDSSWTDLQLPDINTLSRRQDRFYRLHYEVVEPSTTEIRLFSDDGLWLYVNGLSVGHWGGECQDTGNVDGELVDIGSYLQPGENVIAAHVSNGLLDSLFNVEFQPAVVAEPTSTSEEPTATPEEPPPSVDDAVAQLPPLPAGSPFLDLPYDYRGSNFTLESSASGLGGGVSAYFDHQYPIPCTNRGQGGCSPTDVRAVHFLGYDGGARGQAQAGYDVYYNRHSGTDYMLGTGAPVLAAADGVVIFAGDISSVCSDGRTRRAHVIKVQHANTYTTEYWHLSSFASGIEVGSFVTRDPANPIGYAGSSGCVTGPHLHFAVRNPSGVAVDPYGWDPQPDSAWYGQPDPWQRYMARSHVDAASHYLWVQPLKATAATSASAPTVIYSTSISARAIIPAEAAHQPLRVELVEGLPLASIPHYKDMHIFSLIARTADGTPVLTLADNAVVEVRLSAGKVSRLWADAAVTPVLLRWDPEALAWQELTTAWDPSSRIASASTSQLGTLALAARIHLVYLPAIFKEASGLAKAKEPIYLSPFYRPPR
jgi:murein DD-endopeptidase MepM/ murein hydrolase activator NlpD